MNKRTRLTLRYERLRAVTSGIVESASTTFLILIAIEWFHAPAMEKGLIASGVSVGLLLTPIIVRAFSGSSVSASAAAAGISAFGGFAFFISSLFPTAHVFLFASLLGLACYSSISPLLTHIYQENYPVAERGRIYSQTASVKIFTSLIFASLVGWAMTERLHLFQFILLSYAVALFLAAWCCSKIPSSALPAPEKKTFVGAFSYIKTDALFRQTLICWMFLGFGNLMMMPLRVQYLALESYGFKLTELEIGLMVSVLPNIARLLSTPIWGRLFDRMNFFVMRAAANVCFIVSLGSFFMSSSITGLALSALIYGVATSGGDIAWSLWVTKLAPANRTADYMSVHTFLTGVRGVLAPLVGFYLADSYQMSSIIWISLALLTISILILIPGMKRIDVRMGRKAA